MLTFEADRTGPARLAFEADRTGPGFSAQTTAPAGALEARCSGLTLAGLADAELAAEPATPPTGFLVA